jgi:hypothetical protein
MHYPKKSYLTLKLDTQKLQQSLQPGASPALQKEYWYTFNPPLVAFPRIREIFDIANREMSEEARRTALLRLLGEMILQDIIGDEISSPQIRGARDKQVIEEIKKKLVSVRSSDGHLI